MFKIRMSQNTYSIDFKKEQYLKMYISVGMRIYKQTEAVS